MAGSLEFIKSASGTSVSSLSVTDCFSADYDVYKIVFEADRDADQANRLTFLDSGGSEVTSALYDYAVLQLTMNTNFSERIGANDANILWLMYGQNGNSAVIYIYNPYNSSSYSFLNFQGTTDQLRGWKGIGVLKQSATHSGLKITNNTGTYDSISLKIFGVK